MKRRRKLFCDILLFFKHIKKMIGYQITNNYTMTRIWSMYQVFWIDNPYIQYDYTLIDEGYNGFYFNLSISRNSQWNYNKWINGIYNEPIEHWILDTARRYLILSSTLRNKINREIQNQKGGWYSFYKIVNDIYNNVNPLVNRLNTEMYYDPISETMKYKFNKLYVVGVSLFKLKMERNQLLYEPIFKNKRGSKSITDSPTAPELEPIAVSSNYKLYQYGKFHWNLIGDREDNGEFEIEYAERI